MKNFFYTYRGIIMRRLATCFIVLTITVGSFGISTPKEADALFGFSIGGDIVFDPSNFVKNTISAVNDGISALSSKALELKEFTLDPIAASIAKQILRQMTTSIVEWVNTGFDGSPAFIQNLGNYLLDVADQSASDFILGSGLDALCEPFQADVKIALAVAYQNARNFNDKSACTLSDVAGNAQTFLGGGDNAFQDGGGWAMWFQMTTVPQNNIYGAYAMGLDQLQNQVDSAQEVQKEELSWSNGFMSVKDCSSGVCLTVTPGKVIADKLNFALNVGELNLIQADEIDEIFSALMNQLGMQAITGVGGLLGLSQPGSDGSPSYLKQTFDDNSTPGGGGGTGFIDSKIASEQQYLAMHTTLTAQIDTLFTSVSGSSCTAAVGEAAKANTIRIDLQKEIDSANSNITNLNDLKAQFEAATDQSVKLSIIKILESPEAKAALHDEVDVAMREIELDAITKKIDAIDAKVTDELNQCGITQTRPRYPLG